MYVRITVFLTNGQQRTGIRHFADAEKLHDIRMHAARLSEDTLGRDVIIDVKVESLPATDPEVVALLCQGSKPGTIPERSSGEHPYTKEQHRKSLH